MLAAYPSGWRIRVADPPLALSLAPPIADQEINLSFRHWEGAVPAAGTAIGEKVGGRGHVELTGY
jgi:predicted secreted hydrolase